MNSSLVDSVGPTKAIEEISAHFNLLREAHTERYNPPICASGVERKIADAKLLRAVSSALMFVLDDMARSVPAADE